MDLQCATNTGTPSWGGSTGRPFTMNCSRNWNAPPPMEQARAVMEDMLSRLKQTHFDIVPATVYQEMEGDKGQAGLASKCGWWKAARWWSRRSRIRRRRRAASHPVGKSIGWTASRWRPDCARSAGTSATRRCTT